MSLVTLYGPQDFILRGSMPSPSGLHLFASTCPGTSVPGYYYAVPPGLVQ